ncbi:MAG: carboxymuconolactone decarboxylase family protein [Gammaproteobacteria bacterium]|nr:carboxymuconolactone decarboxylase family protein [Gammaproteobacteria bacterium]
MRKESGYVANSLKVAARRPDLMRAVSNLTNAVMNGADIAPELRTMVGYMASRAAGCTYCQAHTSHNSHARGVASEKIQKMWEFERSHLFDAAERAALAFARDAAQQPNAVTAEHYCELRKHYSEEQIVDLLAIVSLFGFFNRWNDSLGTELESKPKEFALSNLTKSGWVAGKHE